MLLSSIGAVARAGQCRLAMPFQATFLPCTCLCVRVCVYVSVCTCLCVRVCVNVSVFESPCVRLCGRLCM